MIYTTTLTGTTRITSDQPPTPEQLAQALRETTPEITCKPYTLSLKVEREEYVDDFHNPRSWDPESTMACFHRRYRLGDEGHGYDSDDYEDWEEMEAAIQENEEPDCILPLRLYDHSGISMSVGTAGGWDSGQVGFIWGRRYEGQTTDQLREMLVEEVSLYNKYIGGEIYYYVVTDPSGEVLDSCTGFFFEEEARTEGESSLKSYWEQVTKEIPGGEGLPIQREDD